MLVLIVEDDARIAEPLVKGLEDEGLLAEHVATGSAALERINAVTAPAPDVVLLDLRLPDMDGLDVCRKMRERSEVPIIVVSARGEEVDKVLGLELGADDYVVKPFGFRELLARVKAVTRRTGPRATGNVIEVGPIRIDRRERRAFVDDALLSLTAKEFDLLALLAEDPGAVWPRLQILEEVWDPHWYGPTKTLDVHIASLRKKLGHPEWIETVRSVGFRLNVNGSS